MNETPGPLVAPTACRAARVRRAISRPAPGTSAGPGGFHSAICGAGPRGDRAGCPAEPGSSPPVLPAKPRAPVRCPAARTFTAPPAAPREARSARRPRLLVPENKRAAPRASPIGPRRSSERRIQSGGGAARGCQARQPIRSARSSPCRVWRGRAPSAHAAPGGSSR